MNMPRTPREKIAAALSTLAVAYFVFWACGPTASFVPFNPPNTNEIGAGISLTNNTPVEVFDNRHNDPDQTHIRYDGQVWAEQRGTLFSVGLTVFFGELQLFGLGGYARWHAIDNDVASMGLELQMGAMWVALSVPTAFHINDTTSIYTNPSLGLRFTHLYLPLGVVHDVGGGNIYGMAGLESTLADEEWSLMPKKWRLGLGAGY